MGKVTFFINIIWSRIQGCGIYSLSLYFHRSFFFSLFLLSLSLSDSPEIPSGGDRWCTQFFQSRAQPIWLKFWPLILRLLGISSRWSFFITRSARLFRINSSRRNHENSIEKKVLSKPQKLRYVGQQIARACAFLRPRFFNHSLF